MADEKKTTSKRRKQQRDHQSNFVAGISVIVLGALSYLDLQNTAAEVPVFIYYGLIGAALGAKWESIVDRLFGDKR